ncbi:hypothetical protein Tco_0982744 [Tanacetum coccineum]
MVNDKGPKDGAVGSGKVTNSPYYLGSNDNPSNIITQKFGFIDETIKQPTEVYELEDWWTVQSMLVSWIMNIIKPSLRTRISYVEEASCRQEGLSIISYYGKLKVIWDELINYEQFPLCKCGKCVCDIAGKLEKKREEERVHQFFIGLEDKTYG